MFRFCRRRFQGWGQAAGGAAAGGSGWGQSNSSSFSQSTGDQAWGSPPAAASGGGGAAAGWGQSAESNSAGAAGWGSAAASGGWGSNAAANSWGGDSETAASMESSSNNFEYRKLTPTMLLEVVKGEPGETHEYYAKMYFGPNSAMQVKHNLWNFLKKFGHVMMERRDPNEPPRWYPVNFKPEKAPKVKIYDADEYDISVLSPSERKNQTAADAIAAQRRASNIGQEIAKGPMAKSTWASGGEVDSEWNAPAPGEGDWGVGAGMNNKQQKVESNNDQQQRYGTAGKASSAPKQTSFPGDADPARLAAKTEIAKLVHAEPRKPMHVYIDQLSTGAEDSILSVAPTLFKELRLAGKLQRVAGENGGYIWEPAS